MSKALRTNKTKNPSPVIQNIIVKPVRRSTQDIESWRTAMKSAEADLPRRTLLYDLYADLLLDGLLGSIIDKRIMAITNSQLTFTIENKPVDEVEDLQEKQWFEDLLTEVMNARFWGHSLVEFSYSDGGELTCELVPRKHVEPKTGQVLRQQSDIKGIPYRKDTRYQPWLIEAGTWKSLGLLLPAAQYVIYKRGNFGDWAQFAEIFGMPFRVGKYDGYDEDTRRQLEAALDEAGSAASIVIPKEGDIDFIESSSKGDGSLYDKLKNACDEQMSIRILGQTMTTKDTSGSGYAQGIIHQEVEAGIHKADRRYVARILNDKLTPLLELHGYKAAGGKWAFRQEENLDKKTKKLDIDLRIAERIPVDDDYFYEEYNIPKPTNYTQIKAEADKKKQQGQDPDPDPKQKKQEQSRDEKKLQDESPGLLSQLYDSLKNFFVVALPLTGEGKLEASVNRLYDNRTHGNITLADWSSWQSSLTKILEDLHRGKLKPEDLNEELFRKTVGELEKGFKQGYRKSLTEISFDDMDYNFLTQIRSNLYNFAGAKSYQQLRDLNNLLIDKKGRLVPFSKFRSEVESYRQAAMKINSRYNDNWLKSEYHNAVNQSLGARRWKEFEDTADLFPNLEYRTAGDSRVRRDHRRLEGTIRPIDDEFWNRYYPPNDWGCRCRARPTDRPATKGKTAKIQMKEMFDNNTAVSGSLFTENHPYFHQQRIDMNRVRGRVDEFGLFEHIKMQKDLLAQLKEAHEVIDRLNNRGGFVLQDAGFKPGQSELDIARYFATIGEGVILIKPSGKTFTKTADMILRGSTFEYKKISSESKVGARLKEALMQAGNIVLDLPVTSTKGKIVGELDQVKENKRLRSVILKSGDRHVIMTIRDIKMKRYHLLDPLFK